VNVYPSEVEAVLLAHPGVAPHYLVVVDRRSAAVRLLVACEVDGAPEQTRDAVAYALQQRLGLRADVVVVPAGTVPRAEIGKARRRVDWTGGEPPLPGLG
jgi:phenylacetate-CoA ligase